jgi:hypothetical protein
MLALMDNHIAQMIHHGADRRAWLVFEASDQGREGHDGAPERNGAFRPGWCSARRQPASARHHRGVSARPAALPGQRRRAHHRV